MSLHSRRTFLQLLGGTVAATQFGLGCNPGDARPPNVSYTLVVDWLNTAMGGLNVKLRAYNGKVPGETLVFKPGDRISITIDNRLPPYDSSAWDGNHNVPHHLNTTNLHLHGLEVIPHLFEPLGTSDPKADMIAIMPGGKYEYLFDIPEDHPSGMFWYHPHHHGSTAVQAVSGMAGVIIVQGPIDQVPEIAAARDVHLAINDLGLFESETEADVWTYDPVQNAIWNTFGTGQPDSPLVRVWNSQTNSWDARPDLKGGFTTGDYAVRFYCANGQPFFREDHNPAGGTDPVGRSVGSPMAISMRPGEVIRLRVLNACSDLVMPMVLTESVPLHLIALDGVNFAAPREMDGLADSQTAWDGIVDYNANARSLVLGPGNRAEMLIKAPASPGSFQLVQLAHSGQQFLSAPRKVVAEFTVAGEPMDMPLPASLPVPTRFQPLIQQSEIVQARSINFTGEFPAIQNPVVGIDFSLNGVQYEVHTINNTVTLGTAEAWELGAAMAMGGNAEGHPFHAHVNSFEVKQITHAGGTLIQPPGTLMDTLWVGVEQTALIWTRFEQWAGKTVYHCHILPHEDTGMMANLLIQKDR